LAVLPVRLYAHRRIGALLAGNTLTARQVLGLPLRVFGIDVAAWGTAGLIMVLIYYVFFLPYAATLIKVLGGCLALGVFSGMLSYLAAERRVARWLQSAERFSLPPGNLLRISKKMVLLIVTVLGIMAVTILLMVLLDVYYLIGRDVSRPEIYWGIFKEIAFALCVLLGISLLIVRRYASNLKTMLDSQLAAMEEISRGNLEKQVPILSRDELARVADQTNRMLQGLKERDFCRSRFNEYVSPEISRKILDDEIAPSGDLIDVTILFCDIRNYTGFAEKRSPNEVVETLNRYFSAMADVIQSHDGVVLQFIGDEIEAVFGAPEPDDRHPVRAVAAALDMRRALGRLNRQGRQSGEPEIRHGIGIHSGLVLAGNVGSPDRKTYAMLGDTVNLASRIQVLNKQLGTDILVSEKTWQRLKQSNAQLKFMGRHAIRGKSEDVAIYAAI
jgi:class 3 adenylate cyclase